MSIIGIEYTLFIGDKSFRPLRAKTLLLDQMAHEPAFDQLRTKEQLGYAVFSGFCTSATTIRYRFIIQSEKTAEYLESKIDSFLNTFNETLEKMSESEFERHKWSLITKRLERSKNLDQESTGLWSHIDSEYLDFEQSILPTDSLPSLAKVYTDHEDAANIKTLTKTGMIEFYSRFILPASPLRSKLVIHLNAQTPSTDGTSVVTGNIEKGIEVLGLNEYDKDQKYGEHIEVSGNGTTPYVITDVRNFKAMLQVSAGPRTVKNISEFEE